tara:strand:- start:495 stop:659 length:165 start_codon:yes stop_codon:yes gene_type:complete
MILKKSPFYIQDKNSKDLDIPEDSPSLTNLNREQNLSNGRAETVHRRRDLDSLG